VPDCLAAYRFHGRNYFYVDEEQVSREVVENRLRLFTIEFAAMKRWLAANGLIGHAAAERSLKGWKFYLESLEFAIKTPSQWRFFWWLVRKNHAERIAQTWKFTIFTYMASVAALVVGYPKRELVYRWRDSGIEVIQRLRRGILGKERNQGASRH